MAEQYEVVVAGAGHNGLMVGAYLAKAGLNVCVLEKQDYVGGGVTTREHTIPGFKHDICSTWHGFIQPNPVIKDDELGLLSKYGLKYLYPDIHTAVLFPDNRYMVFYRDLDRTCKSIAKFSQKDADAYRKFHDWSINTLDMFTTGMFNPPPSFGSFISMLDGSAEGQSLIRSMLVSALDICEEWFESDELKIALTRFASEDMTPPQTKGTGIILFLFIPLMHKYGGGIPVGGSGALSWALERCINDHGGTVKLNSIIKEFKVSGDEVQGAVLETGEEILASKAVVTSLNIKQLLDMVPGNSLPELFSDRVRKIQHADYMAMNSAIALNEAPDFICGGEPNEAMWVEFANDNLEEFLRGFEDLTYGIPHTDFPISIVNTLFDKTRAPEGKHTLYLYHFEPYKLKDGGAARWDEIKDEVFDGMLETMRKQTTNMGDENILGKFVMSPLDFERYNPCFIKGDIGHIGSHIWQYMGNRPVPDWSQYRMPLKKLYLCGASAHPGVGVMGGGRNGAMAIMEDLGIDFEQVVRK